MKLSQEFIREMIRATISEEELGLGFDDPKAPPADEIQQQNITFLEQIVAQLEGISNSLDSNSDESILGQLGQMMETLQGLYPDLDQNLTSVAVSLNETVDEISTMIEKANEILEGMQK